MSFYAACSNQSDMDFLLHQRNLPGAAKRLTLADMLRHEIDLRAARTCNGSQAVIAGAIASWQAAAVALEQPCGTHSERTCHSAGSGYEQTPELLRLASAGRAARSGPARWLSQPCPPSHALPLLPHCHPAACLLQPCRDMPVPRSSCPSSIDAPSMPPMRSGTCRALCRTMCGILCGALRAYTGLCLMQRARSPARPAGEDRSCRFARSNSAA